MNIKTKTRTVSRLLIWQIANQKKKEKLRSKVKQCSLYDGDARLDCYEPQGKIVGVYFLAPGLHPFGIDHPDMKDMCMMLASLGYLVYAPDLVDYRKVYIRLSTYDQYVNFFDRVCDHVKSKKLKFKVNIFSISFGSVMSLKLAGDPKRADLVNSVVIFGGIANWQSTCDHIMQKAIFGRRQDGYGDIRTVPAVFNHLIEYSQALTGDSKNKLRESWLSYMKIAWPDDRYLDRAKCLELAKSLCQDFSLEMKKIFLQGCALEEGTFQLYRTLAKYGNFDHLDPLVNSSFITGGIYLLHGKHDRLIDPSEQKLIKRSLPKRVLKRQVLTKLYAHTKRSEEGTPLSRFLNSVPEMRNLVRILLSISLPDSPKKRKTLS